MTFHTPLCNESAHSAVWLTIWILIVKETVTVKSRVLTRVTNNFFGFLGVHIYETWFKTRGGYIKEIRFGKLKLGWDFPQVFDKLPQTFKNLHFCSFNLTKCCRKGPNFNIFLAIKQSWLIKAQIFQLLTYKISDLSQKWNWHKTAFIVFELAKSFVERGICFSNQEYVLS